MYQDASLKSKASQWFFELQGRIIESLEVLEREYCKKNNLEFSPFKKREWTRDADDHQALPETKRSFGLTGGGGRSMVLKGHLFEKAGVNVSEVYGTLSSHIACQIPGGEAGGSFWASGLSLVIHPRSPLVPTVHMNTRLMMSEKKSWFGGGADLTPMYHADPEEAHMFHEAFEACCNRHDPDYYQKFKEWADTYFFLPHRQEIRGIGGIFYDNLCTGDFEKDFAFTQDVGITFNKIYPEVVKQHMFESWTQEQRDYQLWRRGRYVEFNLLYDRGTVFGLKTGGDTEAILMSLPPLVTW